MRDIPRLSFGRSDDRSCRSWSKRSRGFGRRPDNVITGEQSRGAGLGRGAIAHRVKAGAMQRLHIGVYPLGPAPPTPMAKARAAALACGADAVVSHRSAACLFELLPEIAGDVDVTVAGRNPGVQSGIRLRRVAEIASSDAPR